MSDIEHYIGDYFWNNSNEYILHIGPTNSGKTYNALKALKIASTGIYLSPLRLLAYEVYEGLNSEGILCNLRTGEEKISIPGAQITSATVEICPTNPVEVVVIDECSMVADDYRGEKWLHAMLRVKGEQVHLILNEESEALVTNLLKATNNKFRIERYKRLVPLEVVETPFGIKKLPKNTILVVFSRIDALTMKALFEKKSIKTSVLYGTLPPEVKKEQMEKFIRGETQVCVATDCIGMGLNLPSEYVVFFKMDKFDGNKIRQLNNFEINQIAGRAGRYNQYAKGFVGGVSGQQIKLLKANINKTLIKFSHTWFGLNLDLLKLIPGISHWDKLVYWGQAELVPNELNQIVKMQKNKKYVELYDPQMEQYTLEEFFALISLPVKDDNRQYYDKLVAGFHYRVLRPPMSIAKYNKSMSAPIGNNNSLKSHEAMLSEIDLYLNCINSRVLGAYTEKIEINPIKDKLIDKISTYLVSTKLKKYVE